MIMKNCGEIQFCRREGGRQVVAEHYIAQCVDELVPPSNLTLLVTGWGDSVNPPPEKSSKYLIV